MDPKFVLFLFAVAFATADEFIVGGREAEPGQFPYMASLRKGNSHFCGGAIIGPNHILTAAHCIKGSNTNDITVVTGTNSRTQGGNRYRVAAIYANPEFEKGEYDKDVGILKLADRITFNVLQMPIAISDVRPPEEQYAVIIGWGGIAYPPIQRPERLQYQFVRMIKFSDCHREFPFLTTAICTNNGVNVGVCLGDSGSPLVYNNQVVGIPSGVVACAKGYPDIYSSTAANINFLRRAMTW